MGERDNYREGQAYAAGATAVTGPAAIPDHQGAAPKNPFNPGVPLELAALSGADGSRYCAWLSPQGLEVSGQRAAASAVAA
jgi:hypothetical protein